MTRPGPCAAVRLVYAVLFSFLAAWGLSIASRYVGQQRYTLQGRSGSQHIAIFDRLYGEPFILPLPLPPDDGIIIPRSTK